MHQARAAGVRLRAVADHSVPRIALTYAISVVIDRLAAFLIVGMLAWFHGTSSQSDAYFIAYWLPVALLTVSGEVAFAFIVPKLRALRATGANQEAERRSRAYLFQGGGVALLVTALYLAVNPVLVSVLGREFDASTRDLALSLGLLYGAYVGLMIYTTISGAVAASWGFHGRNAFALPISTVAIAGSIALFLGLGIGVRSFPLGAATGQAVAFVLVLVPILKHLRGLSWRREQDPYRLEPPLGSVRAIFLLTVPVAIPLLLIGVERGLAGMSGTGSAAVLGFARTPLILPGLLAAPIGNALMSRLIGERSHARNRMIWASLSWSIFFGMTAMVVLAIGAEPLLRVLYARGAYSVAALNETRDALLLMLTGFAGMFILPVVMRVLQADRRLGVLLVSSLLSLTYLVLAPPLALVWGTDGLALAFGLATSLPGLSALVFLARRVSPPRYLVRGWLLQAVAAALLIAVHYGLIAKWLDLRSFSGIAALFGEFVVYMGALNLVRVPELCRLRGWAAQAIRGNRHARS